MGSESAARSARIKHKVAVAVEDPELRRDLSRALRVRGCQVQAVAIPTARADDLSLALRDTDADVFVVQRAQLPPRPGTPVGPLAAQVEDPDLVVLTDREDGADRVRLLAAGASWVLPETGAGEELGQAMEDLATGESLADRGAPVVSGRPSGPRIQDFASRSPGMREFLEVVRKVVDSDCSLLLLGETGVGKERLARAIHAEGPRANGPFVSVNIAALSEPLLEAELFGHEAGAFTGAARQRRGLFEAAQRGTILLDEIGEMPGHLQATLLSVLQRHEVRRIGGDRPVPIDVRVMAATNRDLTQDVAEGRFREDLFYRLNVVPLVVPPLREHKEDIPDLVGRCLNHLRQSAAGDEVTGITDEALAALMEGEWLGNVRELINTVERAVLLCEGPQITLADLPAALREPWSDHRPPARWRAPAEEGACPAAWLERPLAELRKGVVARFEKRYLIGQLRATGGRVGETARRAGLSPRALYGKMKRYHLRKEDF